MNSRPQGNGNFSKFRKIMALSVLAVDEIFTIWIKNGLKIILMDIYETWCFKVF